MGMACPKCGSGVGHAPGCADGRSFPEFTAGATNQSVAHVTGPAWQHSTFGRILVGLVLALGLALGVRMFLNTGLLSLSPAEESDVWSILQNLLLRQGLEVGCLLIACILAAAGQGRGFLIGAIVGLITAVVQQTISRLQHVPINEVDLYAQPLINMFVGTAGGVVGSLIWRPLPVVILAPVAKQRPRRPDQLALLFAGPIAWLRVLAGTAVVVMGVMSPAAILNFVLVHSQGQIRITSQLQSTLVTWELIGLFILTGSGIAGFNTLNGPKQGLCVGIASAFLISGYQLSSRRFSPEETIFTAFVLLTLSLIGSWFACRLFPPVINSRRRRISEAP